jgi:hypothetical protein
MSDWSLIVPNQDIHIFKMRTQWSQYLSFWPFYAAHIQEEKKKSNQ